MPVVVFPCRIWKNNFRRNKKLIETKLGCGIKTDCPRIEAGKIVPSRGIFQRHPSQYLRELRRKITKYFVCLGLQVRPEIEPSTFRLRGLWSEPLDHWCGKTDKKVVFLRGYKSDLFFFFFIKIHKILNHFHLEFVLLNSKKII